MLSARFPFVTPEGVLPAEDSARRYVDGGYFDNSAATTAQEMLGALYPGYPEPGRRDFTPILILTARRANFTTQGLNEA